MNNRLWKVVVNAIILMALVVPHWTKAQAAVQDGLSLENKVREVLMCTFPGTDTRAAAEVLNYCNNIALIGVNQNIPVGTTLDQLKVMTDAIHQAGKGSIPVAIMWDQEGGIVATFKDGSLSAEQQTLQGMSEITGVSHGDLFKVAGGDFVLGPVVDSGNSVALRQFGRLYGSTPQQVGEQALLYYSGFRKSGKGVVLKHAPGLGTLDIDTHGGSAVSYDDWETIRNRDLVPFNALIDAGADAVLVNHAIYSKVDSVPASRSKVVIDLMRRDLHRGSELVFITDEVHYMASFYAGLNSPEEGAVQSLVAGMDMVITRGDPQSYFNAVLNAVKAGQISEQSLNEKVERIRKWKSKYINSSQNVTPTQPNPTVVPEPAQAEPQPTPVAEKEPERVPDLPVEGENKARVSEGNCEKSPDGSIACTFPMSRWNADYAFNMMKLLDVMGEGKSRWPINGNATFNGRADCLNSACGYKDVYLPDIQPGRTRIVPGAGACDVAAIFCMMARLNGYQCIPAQDNHAIIPGVPLSQDRTTVWKPGKDVQYLSSDLTPFTYRWILDRKSMLLKIWTVRGLQWDEVKQTPLRSIAEIRSAGSSESTAGAQAQQSVETIQTITQVVDKTKERVKGIGQILDLLDSAGVINKQEIMSYLPLAAAVGGAILIIVILIYLKMNSMRFEIARLKGKKIIIRRYVTQYLWAVVIIFLLWLGTKNGVLWMVETRLIQITAFFWTARQMARIRRHFGFKRPFIPIWIREPVLFCVLLVYIVDFGAIGFSAARYYWFEHPVAVTTTVVKTTQVIKYTGNVSWEVPDGMMELPGDFAVAVINSKAKVDQIAREEGVPPAVPYVLWLKESGGRMNNPGNGEGLCGFWTLVTKRKEMYFAPGPITEEEVMQQLRLCAREFKRHVPEGMSVSYDTTDFNILGQTYSLYNGNIDCHGNPFPNWSLHPYVMNGYDRQRYGMVARDGLGGCVPLQIIGAIPAHIRVTQLMKQ